MERNVLPVDNETSSSSTRTTADGRAISYQMTVLQQPVRARACGQGAKSSADRRPVDPPPIVELKVLQGEKREDDITFTINANYFLFATLEAARPMAQGRVSQERNTPPVLTGTPVAGMVYLDRPNPAGYFIFPDLSVRHEGKYRLSFSLYEELKNVKDDDKIEEGAQLNTSGDAHVTHRLEVKSQPFHVYSAKKFPGLTESTSLSRMVAEQGCRVRIRRDVRMRRREPKNGSKEWDDYEEETAAQRARASATPDPNMYPVMPTPHAYMDSVPRPRSPSNASQRSFGTSISRRPSTQDLASTYQQPNYGTAPQTPQGSYPQALSFAQSQPQQYQPPTFVQQQPQMQPPPPQYQPQTYPAPPPLPASTSPQAYYGYTQPQAAPHQPSHAQYNPSSQAYDPAPPPQRSSIDYSSQMDCRRASAHQIPPPPPPPYPVQSAQSTYQTQAPQVQQSFGQPLPPPPSQAPQPAAYAVNPYDSRPAPMEPLHQSNRPHGSKPSFELPPINTAMMPNGKLEAESPMSAAPSTSYYSNNQTPLETHKRSYGNVFSDRHQNGPLRQGARPSYAPADGLPAGLSAADDDENTSCELDPDAIGMHYRRADGRQILRSLPGNH